MEKFNANGQKLYIDPNWVTGKTCLFTVTDIVDYAYAQKELSIMRKAFVRRLENEGFEIIYDEKDNSEDLIYFIMNSASIGGADDDGVIFKKNLDRIIMEAGGEKFNFPYTLRLEEYFQNPFFPAVFKNELMNGGKDKFFIEYPQQLEIIKRFYAEYKNHPDLSQSFDFSIFQQYIETPTDSKTYMRVLMAASGDVLGASLKYSKPAGVKKREPRGVFEPFFFNEKSKYFLNCSGMFNYYSGGGNISFCQPRYSFEKQDILEAHGINPENPEIPADVLEVASAIAQKCNKELGIMCGIDFIYNANDQKWYYLENQAFPAIDEWAETKGIRKLNEPGIKGYVNYCRLELETRYEALMLCMKKKLAQKDEMKRQRLNNPPKSNN